MNRCETPTKDAGGMMGGYVAPGEVRSSGQWAGRRTNSDCDGETVDPSKCLQLSSALLGLRKNGCLHQITLRDGTQLLQNTEVTYFTNKAFF